MMPYRLQRIDFLPYMFAYEFVIMTRKPLQVPEYEALTYPFDNYIWIFLWSSIAVVSCTLIMLQTIWSTGPGEASPKDSTAESEYLSSFFPWQNLLHKFQLHPPSCCLLCCSSNLCPTIGYSRGTFPRGICSCCRGFCGVAS